MTQATALSSTECVYILYSSLWSHKIHSVSPAIAVSQRWYSVSRNSSLGLKPVQ